MKSKLIIAMTVFFLTGCNTIPKEMTQTVIANPQLDINNPYVIVDGQTISTTTQPSIAIQRWELFYTDPKLRQLIQLGLTNNKDLQNYLLTIQQVKAQFQIADKAMLPILGAGGSVSRQANHRLDRSPSQSYGFNLAMPSYEIDLWGRVANLKEKALNDYLQTTAGKDSAQISVISNIAQMYVSYSYAKAQYEMAASTVKSRTHSLYIIQKRFEAGVDPKTPSLQAASSLENAKLALYDAETNLIKIQNGLQAIIGMPVPVELIPDGRIAQVTNQKKLNAGLPSDLLLYRPDILQAEYNLKAAGANISIARAAFFPKITLGGQVALSSNRYTDLFKNSNVAWSFGPSISVPIFDAGQLDANYKVAEVKQKQALVSYEKSIQNAFKEVSDVMADRLTINKKIQSQYILQNNFDETYSIANARYKAGLSGYLSVLDAERSLFACQQLILQLEQQDLISQIKLYQVLGGGVAIDVPVELSMPNSKDLVQFITSNITEQDQLSGNQTVTTTNIARGSSDVRLATIEDFTSHTSNQEAPSNKTEKLFDSIKESLAVDKPTATLREKLKILTTKPVSNMNTIEPESLTVTPSDKTPQLQEVEQALQKTSLTTDINGINIDTLIMDELLMDEFK